MALWSNYQSIPSFTYLQNKISNTLTLVPRAPIMAATISSEYQHLPQDPDELQKLYTERVTQLTTTPIDTTQEALTLFQILESEPKASSFLRHVRKHDELLGPLQSTTDGDYTVFVPLDSGWTENDHSRAEEAAMVSMHISPHYYTTETLPIWANAPTLLRTAASNRTPVLHITFGSSGIFLNDSKIIKGNMRAKNGIIHLIEKPCLPPPTLEDILSSRGDLSCMAEALHQADESIISTTVAQTIFAPSDKAFKDLGEDVYQFLFRTEQGRPYLNALLKFYILPTVTVFSCFIFPKNDTGGRITPDLVTKPIKGKVNFGFDTLLAGREGNIATVNVTYFRYGGLISMLVNGMASVVVQDVLALNGSLHIMDRIIMPGESASVQQNEGLLTVDELKARLFSYV